MKSLATTAPHAKGRVSGVRLVGRDAALEFRQDDTGLHVVLRTPVPDDHAVVFAISGVL